MQIKSKIKFADDKIMNAFHELENSDKDLLKNLENAFAEIENNTFCGIRIPKRLIPREYVMKYGIKNLWKHNLPNAWRLIYSITGKEVIVISIIIEWLNHKDYE